MGEAVEIEIELKLRSVLVALLSLALGFAAGYAIGAGRGGATLERPGRGWERFPSPAEAGGAG